MEPIVLLGLIIVGYGGYAAICDLLADLGLRLPQRESEFSVRVYRRERELKAPVKKMAGMHV